MDIDRVTLSVPCDLCGEEIPKGTGAEASKERKVLKLCTPCIRALARMDAGVEFVDLLEIGGVWYAPTDRPAAPGGHVRTYNPNVVYHAPPPPEPQKAPKYNPKIPPRRKPT